MPDFHVITTGLRFPEGPVAMPDGSVILVEIERGTLTRVGEDGAVDVIAETGGGPNGAAMGPDGKCYICNNGGFEWFDGDLLRPTGQAKDYTGGRIERVDISTGEVEVLYMEFERLTLGAPDVSLYDPESVGLYHTAAHAIVRKAGGHASRVARLAGAGHWVPSNLAKGTRRWALPDEDALIAALKSNRLGGAGLDVFDPEPTSGKRWSRVPNVILTPHQGGTTYETLFAQAQVAQANIECFLDGRALPSSVL